MVCGDTNSTAPSPSGSVFERRDQQPPAAVGRRLDVAPGQQRSAFGDPQSASASRMSLTESDVDAGSSPGGGLCALSSAVLAEAWPAGGGFRWRRVRLP